VTLQTFVVEVTQQISVTLDIDKFDQAFADEFNSYISDFGDPGPEMLKEHAEHIAQLQARGVIDITGPIGEFIEGYGPSEEMGITADVDWTETNVANVLKPETA